MDDVTKKIIENETKGRKLFIDLLNYYNINNEYNYDIVTTDNLFEFYDIQINTKKKIYIVEIKVRENESNKYSTDLLELNKYLNLIDSKNEMEKRTNKKVIVLYVIFFSDWHYRIFNLNKLENINTIKMINNVCTVNSDFKKKYKDIILLEHDKSAINKAIPPIYNKNYNKNYI